GVSTVAEVAVRGDHEGSPQDSPGGRVEGAERTPEVAAHIAWDERRSVLLGRGSADVNDAVLDNRSLGDDREEAWIDLRSPKQVASAGVDRHHVAGLWSYVAPACLVADVEDVADNRRRRPRDQIGGEVVVVVGKLPLPDPCAGRGIDLVDVAAPIREVDGAANDSR